MRTGKTKLSELPFHVRASVCLGLWSGLAEVSKGFRAPKHLVQLTELLILEAVNIPLDRVRTCRGCGCTDDRACEGGCYWVSDEVCSSCTAMGGLSGTEVRRRAQRDARDREAVERSVRRQQLRKKLERPEASPKRAQR